MKHLKQAKACTQYEQYRIEDNQVYLLKIIKHTVFIRGGQKVATHGEADVGAVTGEAYCVAQKVNHVYLKVLTRGQRVYVRTE